MPQLPSRSRILACPSNESALASLDADATALLDTLASLPGIKTPIFVFPDFAIDHTNSGASGIYIKSALGGYFYPFIAPDYGCGFRLMSLKLPPTYTASTLTEIIFSSSAVPHPLSSGDITTLLTNGLSGLSRMLDCPEDAIFTHSPPEQIDPSPVRRYLAEKIASLNQNYHPYGHFLSIRRVCLVTNPSIAKFYDIQTGDYVAIIHSGANILLEPIIKAFFDLGSLRSFAQRSLPAFVRRAALGVRIDDQRFPALHSLVLAATTFGQLSRCLASCVIRRALRRLWAGFTDDEFSFLSDTPHSLADISSSEIIYQRGPQRVGNSPLFISGGREGWGFLVASGYQSSKHLNLVPHGMDVDLGQAEVDLRLADLSSDDLQMSLANSSSNVPLTRNSDYIKKTHRDSVVAMSILASQKALEPVAVLAPWLNLEQEVAPR